MVRIMVKGGVFTNVEDEILKAAVMKYGKMQWARVASLLNRKSAKQCKARWFEWLDPSIKKTDWTQEEEEKLLHLAKLMPNQWRTIASIVGRTAAQCLEHYERLLDQAQASSASASGEAASSDARKLRPGEIDPAPETKPARPDPVDMDEDEKEMLQEARARLSNTRGKKAKRKAREKQLEEAQRLASLQKRRELKAAGIEMRVNRNKRRKNMDYGSEIPFHMTVPAGFYDTTDEQEATKRARMDPKLDTKFLQDLEAKRRDEEEEKNKKKDAAKIRKLMKTNLPQQIMAVSMLNDPMDVRRRTPLQLPAPQVSDRELEDIAKLGAGAASSASRGAGGLIGDYAEASAPTPMRTPSATSGQDVVMQEARTLLALRSAQTPLLGGENATLEEGTGFDGATPRTSRSETPSMLRESVTPAPGTQVSGTPMQAPLRDQLGLNQSDDFSLTPASRKEQRARERLAKEALKAKLAGLPAPQYSYDISVPDAPAGNGDAEEAEMVEDAAVREAKEHQRRVAIEDARERMQSAPVRRGLPRPSLVSPLLSRDALTSDGPEGEVVAEMVRLVAQDATMFPVKGSKVSRRKSKALAGVEIDGAPPQCFSEEELVNARLMIDEEVADAETVMADLPTFSRVWEQCYQDWAYTPVTGKYIRLSEAKKSERLLALRHQYEIVRSQLDILEARARKVQDRLSMTLGGYMSRSKALSSQVSSATALVHNSGIELSCYSQLHALEQVAAVRRMDEALGAYMVEQEEEDRLQGEYGDLIDKRETLL